MCVSRDSANLPFSLVPNVYPEVRDIVSSSASAAELLFPAVETKEESGSSRRRKLEDHPIVSHDYHDHAEDVYDGTPLPASKGGVTTPFPIKLHEMLEKIDEDGFANVVSWQPHGRCFVIHDARAFASNIMPAYFKQSKLPSFQRQLNLYGFQRLTKGPDKGGYYHELFLRNKVFLAHRIQRMRVKGTGVRARSNPSSEPNFYAMKPVVPSSVKPEKKVEKRQRPRQTVQPTLSITLPIQKLPELPPAGIVTPTVMSDDEDDDLVDFEGMTFHLLDSSDYEEKLNLTGNISAFTRKEMESFLDNLNISRDLYRDIVTTVDDDISFGDLLQRVIE
jgi:hypothetical protein